MKPGTKLHSGDIVVCTDEVPWDNSLMLVGEMPKVGHRYVIQYVCVSSQGVRLILHGAHFYSRDTLSIVTLPVDYFQKWMPDDKAAEAMEAFKELCAFDAEQPIARVGDPSPEWLVEANELVSLCFDN